MITDAWRKSSHSALQDCVEVRGTESDGVEIRDSNDPEGGSIEVTRSEWTAFIEGVKAGEFDLPAAATPE